MPDYLLSNSGGFGHGYTAITRLGEEDADTGITFGVVRLRAGERFEAPPGLETALLLLDGPVAFHAGGEDLPAERGSIFDQEPLALHTDASTVAAVSARGDCELACFQVENEAGFPARLFDGETMMESERRGQGQLDDTAYRIVRAIFDGRNRPEANLVLGEVINFPGRWSSYPPHHHPQPELYHYRFTEPQGYGHAEMGESVYRVRQHDTLKILDGGDHSQVAAPGYGMYYIWAIRHLPALPYTAPEFTEEHAWLNSSEPRVWQSRLYPGARQRKEAP